MTTPFTTTSSTRQDDLLYIAEIHVGVRWRTLRQRHQAYLPFLTTVFEGQIWNGAGNATTEEGTLGFFGFNAGNGMEW
jgi:hypothetical protein